MKHHTFLLLYFICSVGYAQDLTIVEQDFEKAKQLAANENKLLFIDYYTIWCKPCKELDAWVFRDDSLSSILARNFVLLRYDAENDKEYHLSKKYHVSS